ncbi:hypothetical protein ABKN59_010055 [Abortiporus biennis]
MHYVEYPSFTLQKYAAPTARPIVKQPDFLSLVSDKLSFCSASSWIYATVIPSIYSTVQLEGVDQCQNTLHMLSRSPWIARHIQSLTIRPERRHPGREFLDTRAHALVSSALVADAATYMDALHTFVWDGEDYLPNDRMWARLKTCCPNLRGIGTSFGSFLPSPNSHLFAFSDLSYFALNFKSGFYAHQFHVPSRDPTESDPVFSRLFDMLSTRSPNLEVLVLGGTSNEPGNFSRLAMARWPRLRSLTIGDMVFDSSSLHPISNRNFLDFLECHPNLQSLHLLGHPDVTPIELGLLDGGALPKLKSFTGSLSQLRALTIRGFPAHVPPNQRGSLLSPLSSTLESICFPEPMPLRDLTPLAISGVLSSLNALTSLTISFSLQSGYDSNGVLRTIVSSCPQLLHLDLTCAYKPSFYLETFSRTIRNLHKLRTLSLGIVKVPGDEPMHAGAARIALSNPRLQHFTITYLPINTHISRGGLTTLPEPIEQGKFELICDVHGIPVNLLAYERRRGGWSSPLLDIGRSKMRHYVYELRPSGHPDVEKKNWGELLVERSPAGEEARLLGFCLWLLLLTVWGVGKAAGLEVGWHWACRVGEFC